MTEARVSIRVCTSDMLIEAHREKLGRAIQTFVARRLAMGDCGDDFLDSNVVAFGLVRTIGICRMQHRGNCLADLEPDSPKTLGEHAPAASGDRLCTLLDILASSGLADNRE